MAAKKKEKCFKIIKEKYMNTCTDQEGLHPQTNYKYKGLHHQTRGRLHRNLKLKKTELTQIHEILKELQNTEKTGNLNLSSRILHAIATKKYSAQAYDMCINGRKILEAFCDLFDVNGRTLADRIDMVKALTQEQMPMAEINYLRLRGNDGAHVDAENDKISDAECQRIMREIIVCIRVVCEWVITNSDEIDRISALCDESDEEKESVQPNNKKQIACTELAQFPKWIREFAELYGVEEFNLIQKRIMNDLLLVISRSGHRDCQSYRVQDAVKLWLLFYFRCIYCTPYTRREQTQT
eukprot:387457_1